MGWIDQNLVFTNLTAKDSTDVINKLADALYKAGKVNNDFKQAVLDREVKFPTGIPAGKINVAIPHTDVKYVREASLVFSTLKNPVEFANMGDKKQILPVRFVVMLAMKEPHSQVKLLQKLMLMFQDQAFLSECLKLTDAHQFYENLQKKLSF